ncbi:MAG TPA: response regulator [Gemmatimonadales bacterium]
MTQYRLLYVDDDDATLRSIGRYFTTLGYDVHLATSGQEGLGVYEQVAPHVTILDLMMPGMSGMQALEVLRRKQAVVIMLTGHGEIDLAVQAMRLGAENFLQKPVDMPHLAAVVERAVEKANLRRENRELRAGLTPSGRRRFARVAVTIVLTGLALTLGILLGSDEFERPAAPIPVPLERDSGR